MKGKKVPRFLVVLVILIGVFIVGAVWFLTKDREPAEKGDAAVSTGEKDDETAETQTKNSKGETVLVDDTTPDAAGQQAEASSSQEEGLLIEDDVIIELDENEGFNGI